MSTKQIKKIESFREDFIVESIHDTEIKKVLNPSSTKDYDENGNLILEVNYGFGGILTEKYTYKFEENRMVEKCLFYDENDVAETEIYIYENDRITKIIKQYSEGFEEEYLIDYDLQGRIISKKTADDDGEKQLHEYSGFEKTMKSYDEYGELYSIEKISYDPKMRIQKIITENIHEKTLNTIEYQHDENDNIISEVEMDKKGNKIKEVNTEYNANNNPIKITTQSSKEITILNLEYDENGNEIVQEEYSDGELNHSVKRKYNENGHVVETMAEIFNNDSNDMLYNILYEYQYY